jgi:hypothetical protein
MRFDLRRLARFVGLAAMLVAEPACGGGFHRYLGLGWGDGYHVGTTGCPGHGCWNGCVPAAATEAQPVPEPQTPQLPAPERRAIPPEWDTSSRLRTVRPAPRLVRLPPVGETATTPYSRGIVRLPPPPVSSSAETTWR